jgi:hypothetical protein
MSRTLQAALAIALIAGAGTTLANGNAYGHCNKTYEVTITNLTYNQVFSPPLVVSHARSVHLFEVGEPASDGLEALAEGGDTGLLTGDLSGANGVCDVMTAGGVVPPGGSTTITISGSGKRLVSVATMLVNTNDAFAGLNGMKMPRAYAPASRTIPAFDAGTEINDELCANIPGPACGGAGTDPSDGENFVHIHRGIHGVGDLDQAEYDWRNPVAHVSIQRVD